ncbi:MAG TPA: 30S ribosome-binding factor RbfA [Solirubrobacteraceae bacterium]|nr:30S ribosome-binding factor RbfA [Solirubrobacteraceae bacterium]
MCSRHMRRARWSASSAETGPGRMSSGRMRRVDEAIRQVLGEALAGELKDPRVGFVTVTDVRTSADLRHAHVYISVLGPDGRPSEPQERESSLEGLRSAHGFLQGRLAGELHLKRTPTLEFTYDETTDRAMRVDSLIDEMEIS